MLIGLLFIAVGLLVAVFPQILVIMVSTLLVVMGLGVCAVSVQWHWLRRATKLPFTSWLTRF